MTYLYAGLGVAMLAGIMAIFEMGLSLTGQTLKNVPVDPYRISDEAQRLDRQVLAALATNEIANAGESGNKLCDALISQPELRGLRIDALATSDGEKRCVLVANQHLVSITPGGSLKDQGFEHRFVVYRELSDPNQPYRLFSCLTQASRCSFEVS